MPKGSKEDEEEEEEEDEGVEGCKSKLNISSSFDPVEFLPKSLA